MRKLFPDHAYVNLENPELRSLAQTDPKALLNRFPAPVILDEIQRVPELLSWLQAGIDETPNEKGHWIITGSNQLKLRESVTQTLAGRTALLTLLPLSISELKEAGQLKTTFQEKRCNNSPHGMTAYIRNSQEPAGSYSRPFYNPNTPGSQVEKPGT